MARGLHGGDQATGLVHGERELGHQQRLAEGPLQTYWGRETQQDVGATAHREPGRPAAQHQTGSLPFSPVCDLDRLDLRHRHPRAVELPAAQLQLAVAQTMGGAVTRNDQRRTRRTSGRSRNPSSASNTRTAVGLGAGDSFLVRMTL